MTGKLEAIRLNLEIENYDVVSVFKGKEANEIFVQKQHLMATVATLEKELDWGYSIPYMLTGQLNEHPRAAMKARDEGDTEYRQFYRNLLAE